MPVSFSDGKVMKILSISTITALDGKPEYVTDYIIFIEFEGLPANLLDAILVIPSFANCTVDLRVIPGIVRHFANACFSIFLNPLARTIRCA